MKEVILRGPKSETVMCLLDIQNYQDCYKQMLAYVQQRSEDDSDEVWLLQHHPVFTLGRAASRDHVINAGEIPVVQTDRGGEVTYHGPGQLVVYAMLDLRRLQLGVRDFVQGLLLWLQRILGYCGIVSELQPGRPGVYVQGAKIGTVGMRVGRRCSYHGLALNVDMDLSPFERINPCGHPGMQVTSMRELGIVASMEEVAKMAVQEFVL